MRSAARISRVLVGLDFDGPGGAENRCRREPLTVERDSHLLKGRVHPVPFVSSSERIIERSSS
jgi:hypothetical protein